MWGRRDLWLGSVGSSGHEGVPGLLLSALRRPASRDRCVREGGKGLFNIFTSLMKNTEVQTLGELCMCNTTN